uniref:Uncharacterized protein n=1 Tax=Arundo donax TaxID=35708 RepID=A0A0A9AW69_ARUDO
MKGIQLLIRFAAYVHFKYWFSNVLFQVILSEEHLT